MLDIDDHEQLARALDAEAHYRRAEWLGIGGGLFVMNAMCAVFVDAALVWIGLWIVCAVLLLVGAARDWYLARTLIRWTNLKNSI